MVDFASDDPLTPKLAEFIPSLLDAADIASIVQVSETMRSYASFSPSFAHTTVYLHHASRFQSLP